MSAARIAEAPPRGGKTTVLPQLLHDLRSPLNQIIGYSEMLIEEASGQRQDGFVTDLGRIRASGHQLLAVIEENLVSAIDSTAATTSSADDTLRQRRDVVSARSSVAPGLLLVVDDDANNRDVLSRRLVRQGHKVETAGNGRDALLQMRAVAFDAVLLDIMMPDVDGYEVLRQIKADDALQHIPVIMISALNEVHSVVRCIEAGAEDYLTKPFDPTLLKARIGASLEKKRGRDRETALYDQSQKNFKRLQEVEKLRDDMRNMIVHDLRTPLTSLIVGIEMLGKVGPLDETQQPMMTIALSGGKTLLGMINDLLDVEKMESGSTQLQIEQLSARTLIDGAVAQVASLAVDGETTLVTDVPASLPLFRGDQNKLSRTLVNLVANAIKFTQRGTVTISASHHAANIRFAVRDTGEGIPVESFGRIFEKFGQLDPHRVGTGLGLAFCKLAVEAHGGSIDVESVVGAGSVFSFTIPV